MLHNCLRKVCRYALWHSSERLLRRLIAAGADASVGDGYGFPLLEKLWRSLVEDVR